MPFAISARHGGGSHSKTDLLIHACARMQHAASRCIDNLNPLKTQSRRQVACNTRGGRARHIHSRRGLRRHLPPPALATPHALSAEMERCAPALFAKLKSSTRHTQRVHLGNAMSLSRDERCLNFVRAWTLEASRNGNRAVRTRSASAAATPPHAQTHKTSHAHAA